MSLILDNTAGNFAAWQMSIFEHASRLKLVRLGLQTDAPRYFSLLVCSNMDIFHAAKFPAVLSSIVDILII